MWSNPKKKLHPLKWNNNISSLIFITHQMFYVTHSSRLLNACAIEIEVHLFRKKKT